MRKVRPEEITHLAIPGKAKVRFSFRRPEPERAARLGFVGKQRNQGDRPPKFAGFSLAVSFFRQSLD